MNYKALVKLRKQQFDRAERDLAAANRKLQGLLDEKERLHRMLCEIEAPEAGQGRHLAVLLDQKRAFQAALAALDPQIAAGRAEKEEKEQVLKRAHIAWEQAKSLEAAALKVKLQKLARSERSRLDEIAGGRFWRDHRKAGRFE